MEASKDYGGDKEALWLWRIGPDNFRHISGGSLHDVVALHFFP